MFYRIYHILLTFSLYYVYLAYISLSFSFKVISFMLGQIQLLFIKNFIFLRKYYIRNELIWVDGFLLDFLQKKSMDIFLRKFVIYTGFIFSERLVFDYVVRIYLDHIL